MLIHPRALPLVDYPSTNHKSHSEVHGDFVGGYALGHNRSTPFGLQQVVHNDPESDDDLCNRWLSNAEEPEVPLVEDTKQAEEPSGTDIEMRVADEEIFVKKTDQPGKPIEQFPEPIPCTSIPVATTETVSEKRVLDTTTLPHHTSNELELGKGPSSNIEGESDLSKDKGFLLKLDHDDSSADEDALPDIVDADPDSDSN